MSTLEQMLGKHYDAQPMRGLDHIRLSAAMKDMALELDEMERFGAPEDKPEGARNIMLSDTGAQLLARILYAVADELERLAPPF